VHILSALLLLTALRDWYRKLTSFYMVVTVLNLILIVIILKIVPWFTTLKVK
jgi:hypothetical protein